MVMGPRRALTVMALRRSRPLRRRAITGAMVRRRDIPDTATESLTDGYCAQNHAW